MPVRTRATAVAPSNIALVKYWGKRDVARNLPVAGSISVTLEGLTTRTSVGFDPALEADEVVLDGTAGGPAGARVSRFLDLLRARAGTDCRARVETRNDFPTAAGLASSASGFAALTLAGAAALGLTLTERERSALARRGSGSAARSFAAGYVEMHAGTRADGSDAYAQALAAPAHLPLALLAAVTDPAPKPLGSTEAMARTQATSPYWDAWVAATRADLDRMRAAILAADLARVGTLAEANCLRLHALALAAQPPVRYWLPATVAVMRAVEALRARGTGAWFTIDAGPQVKVLCAPGDAAAVRAALEGVPGVAQVLAARPGPGARLVAEATR